jgi:hypothetical protein
MYELADVPNEDNMIWANMTLNTKLPIGSRLILKGLTGSQTPTALNTFSVAVSPLCECSGTWIQVNNPVPAHIHIHARFVLTCDSFNAGEWNITDHSKLSSGSIPNHLSGIHAS